MRTVLFALCVLSCTACLSGPKYLKPSELQHVTLEEQTNLEFEVMKLRMVRPIGMVQAELSVQFLQPRDIHYVYNFKERFERTFPEYSVAYWPGVRTKKHDEYSGMTLKYVLRKPS